MIPGSPPRASTVQVPRQSPSAEEVLLRVQAAALTATDVQLCQGTLPGWGQSGAFVPGIFFTGKVLSLGKFVHGLRVGELVLGLRPPEADCSGGCYCETLCAHYSVLIPLEGLVETKFQPTTILAHVPPMISALMCVASQLRLQPTQALLLLAPRLEEAIFILQRLVISESWCGPLYLVLLTGELREENLEHHPMLQPLLGEGSTSTLLQNVRCFSVEDRLEGRRGASTTTVLQQLLAEVQAHTGGVGVDAILALDMDLSPEERAFDAAGDIDAACVALEPAPRQRSLLRSLIGALALGGRLVTSSGKMEMSPDDAQQLWAKECSISFFNPHCMPLSMLRHGELLHAATEVCSQIVSGELCVADSEVAQFYLFDQFQQALDAASHKLSGVRKYSSTASGAQLVTLLL